jgi:hypothetical protein
MAAIYILLQVIAVVFAAFHLWAAAVLVAGVALALALGAKKWRDARPLKAPRPNPVR